jgi:putative nucleotidyltransferase with HDIG domain
MQVVSVDDLIDHKILPYNLYNQEFDKIMTAGEVLTPGKLLQLRYLSVILRDAEYQPSSIEEPRHEKIINVVQQPAVLQSLNIKDGKIKTPQDDKVTQQDMLVNLSSTLTAVSQVKMKSLYNQALQSISQKANESSVKIFQEVRDKVIEYVLPIIDKINHKSQLKMLGDYEVYHGLNVSILSIVLAKKMGLSQNIISEIALAGLLHDVGKTRLPKEVLDLTNITAKNIKFSQLHPQIGYKILKNEMHMPESICKIALEHHEKNDGSGYPYGISGDLISHNTQIISVCNLYENMISGQTTEQIKTPKEAVKKIIESGTSCFSPDILYTFVHMTSFNDNTPIENLGAKKN